MRHADFLAQIAAAPHDAALYLVYADAYLRYGDPRGELVVVQHALETAGEGPGAPALGLARREAELLDQHLEAWLGPICAHRDALAVRWRRGFIAGARVRLRGQPADAAPLGALLAVPEAAAALVELRLGPNEGAAASCQPLVDELAARRPPALRRLLVGDAPLDEAWTQPALELDLGALPPRLEALAAHASSIALRGRAPAGLRELLLGAPALDPRRLLEAGAWPALESLTLWCAAPRPLAAWLDPARFPRLRALALCGAADGDAVAAELRGLPIARQLEAIAITGSTVTAWGAHALATLPRAVRLDLRRNNLPAAACAHLARRGEALAEPQSGNVAPFTDLGALRGLRGALDRSAAEVWTRALGAGGDPDRAVADRYELGDPRWGERKRLELVRTLPPRAARELCLAIERRWAAELAPELREGGGALYRRLGEASAQLGELDAAERLLWRAHGHARWYGVGTERDLLAEIATLRLRQDAAEAALPLLDQLHEQLDASADAARRARRSGVVLAISFAELARGRPARAEAACRRAAELADATPATSELERAALAAMLWARHDVESVARGAWLFAVRRRQLDPAARADEGLAGLAGLADLAGTEARAARVVRRTLGAFERHRDAAGIALACALLGELEERAGRPARAAAWIDRALAAAGDEAAGTAGTAPPRAVAHGIRARIALGRGDLAGARAAAGEALALHRADGHQAGEALALLALADVATVAGRLDEAEAGAGEALAQLLAAGEFPAAAAAHLRLGQLAQLRRRRADAERRLRTAIACAERDRYLRERPRGLTPGRGAASATIAPPPAPPPRRELEVIGRAELWLAVLHAQDCRLRDAYRLLGRARARLHEGSAHAAELLATATAILGRYAGSRVPLPSPRGAAARAMHGLLA